MMNALQREITLRWRKAKTGGRLYWRKGNSHWRDWDGDAIAVAVYGSVKVWFYTIEAIENEITELGEEGESA